MYRLVEVYDVREYDPFEGRYLPLEPGSGNICMRCGREHAKVFELENVDTKERYLVGSGCCKKAFGGWEPSATEVKAARGRTRSKKKLEAEARLQTYVQEATAAIVAQVRTLGLAPPAPVVLREVTFAGATRPHWVWGDPSSPDVNVWQHEAGPITAERLSCYTHAWWREQIRPLLPPYRYPDGSKGRQKEAWLRLEIERAVEDALRAPPARRNPDEQSELPFDEADPLAALEEKCPLCGEVAFVDVAEYWPQDRSFTLDTCCESSYYWWLEEMREWTPDQWAAFFAAKADVHDVRSVGGHPARRGELGIHEDELWVVDQGIALVRSTDYKARAKGLSRPGQLTRAEIKEFVRRFHAHAGSPPSGYFWGYGVYNGPPSDPEYDGKPKLVGGKGVERPTNLVRWPAALIGVAMVGKPWARMTNLAAKKRGEKVCDVTRIALNHGLPSFVTYKAASMIYERSADDARAAGFDVIQTFTLASESGMSLRYARWKKVGVVAGGQITRESRERALRSGELEGEKVKWEKRLKGPSSHAPESGR